MNRPSSSDLGRLGHTIGTVPDTCFILYYPGERALLTSIFSWDPPMKWKRTKAPQSGLIKRAVATAGEAIKHVEGQKVIFTAVSVAANP